MLFLNVVHSTNRNSIILAFVLSVLINAFSWQLPFFWDTILTSTITQFFFENGYGNFISPPEFDAGHPPLFYIYVTGCYYLLGKSLFAAHFSILPFTLAGSMAFISILNYLKFSQNQIQLGLLLFFCIPAVITQNLMVSYDVVLLSMYLMALASFFYNRKFLYVLAILVIAGVSLRGLFCVVSISLTVLFFEHRNIKSWIKWNLLFIPAVLLVGLWYYYHFTQTGWLFSTSASGWSTQRGLADITSWLKNGLSIFRVMFDLGIVLLLLISLFTIKVRKKFDKISILWLVPLAVFSILMLPFSNPVNHRYFLVVYVLMIPGVLLFLSSRKVIFTILILLGLVLGNFQLYHAPVSNAWDCTLAHLSYFELRNTVKEKTYEFNIPMNKIGTVFPMNTSFYQTRMIDDKTRLINVNGISIDTIPYILYSATGNDFSDEQFAQFSKWKKIVYLRKGQVDMILYENPKNSGK